MNDVAEVQCPYCFEFIEVWVEPDVEGELVFDCEVCCNPWRVCVTRDAGGDASYRVDRAQ